MLERRSSAGRSRPGGLDERAGCELALLVDDLRLRDLAWAMIDPDDAEQHAALWQRVVSRVPPALSAAPLALLGMAGWISGDGALLNCAPRSCAAASAYSMGAPAEQISDRAISPRLWHEHRRRACTADLRRELERLAGWRCTTFCHDVRLSAMTRFVVCGETLIDLVPSDQLPPELVSSTWLALSAGGPMNSAVALGKLGADVHFLGRLSTDAFGRQLRQHILGANVQLDLATESSQATSIAVVSLDDEGVASYTFHFNDTANFGWQVDDLPELADDDWLHIASLSCVVSPGAEVLLDWMRGVTAGVSYDINVRPTVITDPEEYWAKVQPWLRVLGQRDGIVKASDEDIEFLAQAAGASRPRRHPTRSRWRRAGSSSTGSGWR